MPRVACFRQMVSMLTLIGSTGKYAYHHTSPGTEIENMTTVQDTTQLRDELATVDLRYVERLSGRPIVLTTPAEHLELEFKRVTAVRYLCDSPTALVARRASEIALLTLPSVSR